MDAHRFDLTLRPLAVADEAPAVAAHAELAAEGHPFLLELKVGEGWAAYLVRLERARHGVGVRAGTVPATFLVATVGHDIVGRVSVRHRLNPVLEAVGGHIGYAVRPGFRRLGYATEMLRQALAVAGHHGVTSALVTCHDDNVASAATITRCGGVLANVIDGGPYGSRPVRRYWVPVPEICLVHRLR